MLCTNYVSKNRDLEAKQSWIYSDLLMSVGPFGPGGGIYSIIEDVVYKVYYKETDLEAKQSWIYAVLLMSVGPVGPKGGIYPIMEDVLCRVNF